MDSFHQRLVQIALAAAAQYDFCLAGGYAVQAHGFVERPSKDVDLFTTMAAASDFPAARAAVTAALRADGLEVTVEQEGPSFARLMVADPGTGNATSVELGIDWRAHQPVQLAIGPVLHPADAVANKVCALFGRAEVRDYIDVYGVLKDGRYTRDDLLRMAVDHDPGFDSRVFAQALRAVHRFPASAFEPYKLTSEQVDSLRIRLLAWAEEIDPASP